MRLPGYYLTEAEQEILTRQWPSLLDALTPDGRPFELVELGSGDGRKTLELCTAFSRARADFTYVPVDISPHAINQLQDAFAERLPGLTVRPRTGDYFSGWARHQHGHRQIVMFMGSNLGNMPHEDGMAFLRQIRRHMQEGDGLLLGLDLMKDPQTILAAYDDPQGVTAAFNLNLLARMNREMGMDFQLDRFSHYASYSPLDGAARSFLVSRARQTVRSRMMDLSLQFEPGEVIYTEQSQKYSPAMIAQMARDCGFAPSLQLQDGQGRYCVSFWQAINADIVRHIVPKAIHA
jgi:dimethylhistidine N-methyltransferase